MKFAATRVKRPDLDAVPPSFPEHSYANALLTLQGLFLPSPRPTYYSKFSIPWGSICGLLNVRYALLLKDASLSPREEGGRARNRFDRDSVRKYIQRER